MDKKGFSKDDLTREQIFDILENIYNEVYVLDKDKTIIFINSACQRHYGLLPEDFIGKNHELFSGTMWYPSIIPNVFKEKRTMSVKQMTYMGNPMIGVVVPVLDQNGEIEMVVSICEEKIQNPDIGYDQGTKAITYPEEHGTFSAPTEVESGDTMSRAQKMQKIIHTARKSAQMDLSILIQGESGTGKSMLAKYIHDMGQRKNKPFMEINCAAIPEALLESELFGYEPNSFTNASAKGKKGLLEMADGGTLFLDEIGDLAITLQAKLLNVIEDKQFFPVGGTKIKQVDVRIIAATNKHLKKLVAEKQFREDLFWRINVMDLVLPPLRERVEDIEYLQQIFLDRVNMKYGMNKKFSEEVKEVFLLYYWPGNIRQLKNVVERAVVMAKEEVIQVQDLPERIIHEAEENNIYTSDYETCIYLCTKKIVTDTYDKYKSSRKVAEELNISQSTASRLIKKYVETEKPI